MTVNYDAASRYLLDDSGQTASRIENDVLSYTRYVVRQGDTLEALAHKYLGNWRRYWEIADANPQIKFPLDISVGTILRLPS